MALARANAAMRCTASVGSINADARALGLTFTRMTVVFIVACDNSCLACHEACAGMQRMNAILVEAIHSKRRLRFVYNGRVRIVEPQCHGLGMKGTELLRAHQLQGGSEREPLFDVSKMSALEPLDQLFTRPGPNYKKDDSAMKTIFAQL